MNATPAPQLKSWWDMRGCNLQGSESVDKEARQPLEHLWHGRLNYFVEKAEICDTEDILEHLQYKGFLTNHTVDELIRSIQERKASQHILLHPNISILNSSKRPQTTVPTTPELTTPKRPLTGSEPSSQSFVESHLLYEIAHYCRYASIALLSAMLLIVSISLTLHSINTVSRSSGLFISFYFLQNIIRVAALRMKFLHSKLQVLSFW